MRARDRGPTCSTVSDAFKHKDKDYQLILKRSGLKVSLDKQSGYVFDDQAAEFLIFRLCIFHTNGIVHGRIRTIVCSLTWKQAL